MKLQTTTHVQDYLDNELAWRVLEISDLKTSIKSRSGISQRTLIRAGIPILYAHWEGYIKVASDAFLQFVSNRGLPYRELKSCFIVHGLTKYLRRIATLEKSIVESSMVEFILNEMDKEARLYRKGSIDTESNLTSSVFEDIANSVGLSISNYTTKFKLIDEALVHRRNRIAHGEFLDVDEASYSDLSTEVLALLRNYKTDIENAIVTEGYKR